MTASAGKIRIMSTDLGDHDLISDAALVLDHAHRSASGFLESWADVRKHRNAKAGTSTDREQDLARAALIFAAAGLDSVLKQLMRDTLPDLIRRDEAVRKELEKFIDRRSQSSAPKKGSSFLAQVLATENRLDHIIDAYIEDLVGSSLQSVEELSKATAALGLSTRNKEIAIDRAVLKPIFAKRNVMIHELDIALDSSNRNRNSRTKTDMAKDANALLELAEQCVRAVGDRLTQLGL